MPVRGTGVPFLAALDVTDFVTRQGGKEQERTGKNRTNRTLQAVDIATNCGETIAKASVVKNCQFSLLISGP
jgi:hypothetical protein